MPNHPTLYKLLALKMTGMAKRSASRWTSQTARPSVSRNAWACW